MALALSWTKHLSIYKIALKSVERLPRFALKNSEFIYYYKKLPLIEY